jgi:hypothetical protein
MRHATERQSGKDRDQRAPRDHEEEEAGGVEEEGVEEGEAEVDEVLSLLVSVLAGVVVLLPVELLLEDPLSFFVEL